VSSQRVWRATSSAKNENQAAARKRPKRYTIEARRKRGFASHAMFRTSNPDGPRMRASIPTYWRRAVLKAGRKSETA
jgi:hypothetical protein